VSKRLLNSLDIWPILPSSEPINILIAKEQGGAYATVDAGELAGDDPATSAPLILDPTQTNQGTDDPGAMPAVDPRQNASGQMPVQQGGGLPFDPRRLPAALLRRWLLILLVGGSLAAVGGLAGFFKLTASYRAGAQLMRQESSANFRASELGEPFKPRQLSVPTLVSFMKSPAVLQRVAEHAQLPARSIGGGLTITPERNTDLITLGFVSTRSAQTSVRVLNAFGNEVVRLTKDMQSQEATDVNRLLKRQLTKAESDLRDVNRELLEFSREAGLINVDKEIDAYLRNLGDLDMRYETMRIEYETLDLKISALERELVASNPQLERVQIAREKLGELLLQYTDANPLVQEQRAVLAELETRLKDSEGKPIAPPRQGEGGLAPSFYADLVNLKTQKQVTAAQLEKLRVVRTGVDEKLRGLPEKGMQLARIKARQQSLETSQSLLASRQREAQLYEENAFGYYRFFEARLDEVEVSGRANKLVLLVVAGGFFGTTVAVLFVCLMESLDDRIKTPADLKRITKLPLLAALPPLGSLDAVAQSNSAFRTWLALQARLSTDAQRGMVCGFISANGQEGCSTWIELLGRAASQRDQKVVIVTNREPVNGNATPLDDALLRPSTVELVAGRPVWLIAPVGWRWDAARRLQWQDALTIWNRAGGLVALVELTAADQPETLVLAETMPQLIWLAASGVANGRDTAQRLQTFRDAGCRFAGTVLNREVKLFSWL